MNISREVKIGGFALTMLVMLFLALNFIKGEDLLSGNNKYLAFYGEVGGLQPSAPIFIKGIKVGNVSTIEYRPSVSQDVELQLNISSKYQIPQNSTAKIFSNGLMGGKAIEIALGDSKTYLQDGSTLMTQKDPDIMEVAGSEFDFFKQKFSDLSRELQKTLLGVNTILAQNSNSLNASMTNLASITGSVDGILTSNQRDIRELIANLNGITATINSNTNNLNAIINNVAVFSDSLKRSNVPTLVDNLGRTLGQVDVTLAKINNGHGSLGMLVNDRTLYDSLTMATGSLSRLLDDLKAHPSRYINVTIFGRKSKEAK